MVTSQLELCGTLEQMTGASLQELLAWFCPLTALSTSLLLIFSIGGNVQHQTGLLLLCSCWAHYGCF